MTNSTGVYDQQKSDTAAYVLSTSPLMASIGTTDVTDLATTATITAIVFLVQWFKFRTVWRTSSGRIVPRTSRFNIDTIDPVRRYCKICKPWSKADTLEVCMAIAQIICAANNIRAIIKFYDEYSDLLPGLFWVALGLCIGYAALLQCLICDLYNFYCDRRKDWCLRDLENIMRIMGLGPTLRWEITEKSQRIMMRLVRALKNIEKDGFTDEVREVLHDLSKDLKITARHMREWTRE
jgi:hypothetical protein